MPATRTVISVVVPVYNAAATLALQLEALARQHASVSWELVLADNGSTDSTVEIGRSFEDRLPGLRIVDASDTRGVGHARNVGAAESVGEAVAFCDADDEVDAGWIAAIAAAAERYHIFGGALDRRRFTPSDRRRPGLVLSSGLSRPFPDYLPFASGANLCARRELFEELGGFDESFAGGGDDVDFSWRAQHAGYELGFAAEAVVHYRERSDAGSAAKQFYRYGVQDPHLYSVHRRRGMPRNSARSVASSWAGLTVGGYRFAGTPSGRAQWTRSISRRAGRVVGSVRYRTFFL